MPNVIDYPAPHKAATVRRYVRIDPIIAEVIDALIHFRGQAHRDDICHFIASRRAGESVLASEGLKVAVFAAFRNYLDTVAQAKRVRSLLHQPFGEGSHRWGLTLEGQHLFRSKLAIPSV